MSKVHTFDILVIGAGIAGLSFCLEAARLDPQARIALILKNDLGDGNSPWAQGGMAASQAQDLEAHIADTLKAGDGQCLEPAVRAVLAKSHNAVDFLVSQGVCFDQGDAGPDLVKEGGHSVKRIYHVKDHTGYSLIETLKKNVADCSHITVFDYHIAINLIQLSPGHKPQQVNEIVGAYVLNEKQNRIDTFAAKCVVLATGGAGKVYRYTTNSKDATGDGIAMAYRAGARVGGMEFYQFHPTLLYSNEENHFLISEVVRGKGAYLRSPVDESRFMKKYAPEQMEMATRDVVARAIFNEIENQEEDFVWLDARHLDQNFLQNHFPMIYKRLKALGIDMAHDMIPVVPAAHYLCGGILTNVNGETDLKRLYAIGETAFTGLHGANRLASNSLLEGVVMALNAAEATMPFVQSTMPDIDKIPVWDASRVVDKRRASQINAHWRGLRGEMNSYAGIIRTESGLRDLLQLIKVRRTMIEDYYSRHMVIRDLIELRNICLIAKLIVKSALLRENSSGCHFREDYPQKPNEKFDTLLGLNESFLRAPIC